MALVVYPDGAVHVKDVGDPRAVLEGPYGGHERPQRGIIGHGGLHVARLAAGRVPRPLRVRLYAPPEEHLRGGRNPVQVHRQIAAPRDGKV